MSSYSVFHTCELCERQFNTHNLRWMQKQRLHASVPMDMEAIVKCIDSLETLLNEIKTEMILLRSSYKSSVNNRFGAISHGIANVFSNCENVTVNNNFANPSMPPS
jgi:hypothetical protein